MTCPEPDPWSEYLAAARQLITDGPVTGGTGPFAGRDGPAVKPGVDVPAQPVRAARAELDAVRARLAPQRLRLSALGVPEADLRPSRTEVAAAGRTMTGDPAGVLAALRAARSAADRADAAIVAGQPAGSGPGTLVGYALAAVLVLVLLACLGVSLPRLLA